MKNKENKVAENVLYSQLLIIKQTVIIKFCYSLILINSYCYSSWLQARYALPSIGENGNYLVARSSFLASEPAMTSIEKKKG